MDAPGFAALGGLVGGLVFLMVVTMGYATGMTRMNFLQILGTMMSPRILRRNAYLLGFAIHMMASIGFGFAHGAIVDAIGVTSTGAGAGWGALLGTVHGVGILMMLPVALALMHPLVRKGEIERPGVALTGFGAGTPLGSLMAHVAFGVTVGAVYAAGAI